MPDPSPSRRGDLNEPEHLARPAPNPGDADHVLACLAGGGFGRLPIPWREPIPVWWAA